MQLNERYERKNESRGKGMTIWRDNGLKWNGRARRKADACKEDKLRKKEVVQGLF